MTAESTQQNGVVLENDDSMDVLRIEINDIDNELLQLLSRRMNCAKKIGAYKKRYQLPILQVHRWQEILDAAVQKGEYLDLSEPFITQFLTAIHDESIRHQTLIWQAQ
jgi:chorismate mutase